MKLFVAKSALNAFNRIGIRLFILTRISPVVRENSIQDLNVGVIVSINRIVELFGS